MQNIYQMLKLLTYTDDDGILMRAEITDGYMVRSEKKIGFTLTSAEPVPASVLLCLEIGADGLD